MSHSQAVLGVLQWLHEEEAVDAPYLQAALAELDASLAAHGIPAPARLHALSLDVALQLGQSFQVTHRWQPLTSLKVFCHTQIGTICGP